MLKMRLFQSDADQREKHRASTIALDLLPVIQESPSS